MATTRGGSILRDPDSSRGHDLQTTPSTKLVSEDREAVIARLSTAFADDHVSAEEFERRVTDAYRVTTHAALAELTADLPRKAEASVSRQEMPGRISSVLSSIERGGRMLVPTRLEIRSILGNVALDLRDAEFEEGVTVIAVQAILGNVEVLLPSDVYIESHGSAFLGNFAHRGLPGRSEFGSDPPRTIRITGRAVLGNVDFDGDTPAI